MNIFGGTIIYPSKRSSAGGVGSPRTTLPCYRDRALLRKEELVYWGDVEIRDRSGQLQEVGCIPEQGSLEGRSQKG